MARIGNTIPRPTRCESCGGSEFNHFVCCNVLGFGADDKPIVCGWRPCCPWCGKAVDGRPTKLFCSDSHRWKYRNAEALVRQLVALDDEKFRQTVAIACSRRWGGPGRYYQRYRADPASPAEEAAQRERQRPERPD